MLSFHFFTYLMRRERFSIVAPVLLIVAVTCLVGMVVGYFSAEPSLASFLVSLLMLMLGLLLALVIAMCSLFSAKMNEIVEVQLFCKDSWRAFLMCLYQGLIFGVKIQKLNGINISGDQVALMLPNKDPNALSVLYEYVSKEFYVKHMRKQYGHLESVEQAKVLPIRPVVPAKIKNLTF